MSFRVLASEWWTSTWTSLGSSCSTTPPNNIYSQSNISSNSSSQTNSRSRMQTKLLNTWRPSLQATNSVPLTPQTCSAIFLCKRTHTTEATSPFRSTKREHGCPTHSVDYNTSRSPTQRSSKTSFSGCTHNHCTISKTLRAIGWCGELARRQKSQSI